MEKEIVNWIKKYCLKNRINSLIVGVSGGVDSALVSTICCETGIKTFVVSLPLNQKKDQLDRARNHIDWLSSKYRNVIFVEKDLTSIFNVFLENLSEDEKSPMSLANTKSRLRMVMLYQIASNNGGIVVGTGNKIEDFGVGFFTKYGDGGVDISPIADLTKTEVRSMSKKLGIADDIIKATPTDGLWEIERTDEEQLGATYEELEWAMSTTLLKKQMSEEQARIFKIYRSFNRRNKHKMNRIPVFKKKK